MIYYYFVSVLASLFLGLSGLIFWPTIPVLWMAVRQESKRKVFVLAFITGLFVDLLWMNPLGASSIFLLTGASLVIFLNEKFKSSYMLAFTVFLLSQVMYHVLVRLNIFAF